MRVFSQNDIDEMKQECLNEYPFPYWGADRRVIDEVYGQLKEVYKDASLHRSTDFGYAICLDNLSRTYYAAMLIGASSGMSFLNGSCITCPERNALKWEKEGKNFVEQYELETVFKAQRDDLSDCFRLN